MLAGAWYLAIRQMSLEWDINPEYAYGWIVPLLTLLLAWRAWGKRPAEGRRQVPTWAPLLVLAIALAAIPARVIQEANPDWRLFDYYFTLQAIALTSLVLDASGGRPWLRHFAFPLLFPLVAIPWPSGIEFAVIQGLQRCVAAIGAEGASWLGWSAWARGNLIALPQGVVDVNEACSGIRSLQSSLMISLFLGDYFQLRVARRWLLVGLALVFAFLLNVGRAFFLITVMAQNGAQAVNRFHDPAGFSIAFGTLLLLWIAASYLARGAAAVSVPSVGATTAQPLRFPWRWSVALLAVWLAAEVFNQGWYLALQRRSEPAPLWTLRWPPPRAGFHDLDIDETARALLRYDLGRHGAWSDRFDWELFFFTWNPGRASAGLAQSHHPDYCLTAAGYVMKEDLGTETMTVNRLALPMHRYIFVEPGDGRLLYVFQAVTDDRIWPSAGPARDESIPPDYGQRLKAVWEGQRDPGQRSLLLVNKSARDMAEADRAARELLAATVEEAPPE
jgi:exosortase